MDEYRNEAKKRYYEKQKLEEEAKAEQFRIVEEQQRQEEEQQRQEEQRYMEEVQHMNSVLHLWDTLLITFPITVEAMKDLHTHVHEVIPLFQRYDRMEEIQERMIHVIEIVNTQHEVIPHSVEEVKRVHDVMKNMIDTCQVDVTIETMDVSQDETMAQRVQEELFHDVPLVPLDHLAPMDFLNPIDHDMYLPFPIQRPICSYTRRVGLTVPQLKELARTHHISQQGSKEDLCRRLADAGWVTIV